MKPLDKTLIIVVILCGFVASFIGGVWSVGAPRVIVHEAPPPLPPANAAFTRVADPPEMIEVIVAKKELPVGTILDEAQLDNYLGRSKFPKESLPPDVITNVDELKGKRLNRTLKPGNWFAADDVSTDVRFNLPEGMVKYTIQPDIIGFGKGGRIQPGHLVVAVLTETLPSGKAKSSIILRELLVVATDMKERRPSVSVAVTSEQAQVLAEAEKRGELKFLLLTAAEKREQVELFRDPNDQD